ncbi:hypothetical protein [Spirosoma spitsbergense]|jgi:hypothetical protein|uniref:hypothetical protein n=1 Tax=Spirosoma spitsbergense TaxID=431554 RepID=UPI00036443BD|nr:hypothetical protein [Spirosoma spitsbergense]
MNLSPSPRRLSNAQSLLLQLFERDLPESELIDVRRVLTKHFAQKAEEEAERILNDRHELAQDIEKDSAGINENRTNYAQTLRSSPK